jgi:cystathionine beta-lyase/cystathionine gamma-synthase
MQFHFQLMRLILHIAYSELCCADHVSATACASLADSTLQLLLLLLLLLLHWHEQSLTKYYDGHNMTVGGAVISATAELDTKIHFYQNVHGNILSPQCAFIVLQSTKVLLSILLHGFPC